MARQIKVAVCSEANLLGFRKVDADIDHLRALVDLARIHHTNSMPTAMSNMDRIIRQCVIQNRRDRPHLYLLGVNGCIFGFPT
jgi:hypothetical protein